MPEEVHDEVAEEPEQLPDVAEGIEKSPDDDPWAHWQSTAPGRSWVEACRSPMVVWKDNLDRSCDADVACESPAAAAVGRRYDSSSCVAVGPRDWAKHSSRLDPSSWTDWGYSDMTFQPELIRHLPSKTL